MTNNRENREKSTNPKASYLRSINLLNLQPEWPWQKKKKRQIVTIKRGVINTDLQRFKEYWGASHGGSRL